MSQNIVSLQERLKRELARQADTLPPVNAQRISIKSKKFTLPDGTSSGGPLSCIILDYTWVNELYEANYNPNNYQPPVCTGTGKYPNEMAPDKTSSKPQKTETCKACPMNQWGTDPKGGKGKACKNSAKIAVVPGKPNAESQPWVVNIPPTSLTSFQNYLNLLNAQRLVPMQVLTEISFDSSVDYPKLNFKTIEPHDFLPTVLPLLDTAASFIGNPIEG